ncbi:biofilm formation protein PslA [Rhodospirillales bacterium TMPK1]|uniref:Biofilm formation protein PslA n=2 Tax=Roseiterribacter gracilis TaxID=2812848 RepID=A0A8S8X5S7_9PROT|nr:biofilm formation protein PslA [Rhodospirillales bacterium TMPK1]
MAGLPPEIMAAATNSGSSGRVFRHSIRTPLPSANSDRGVARAWRFATFVGVMDILFCTIVWFGVGIVTEIAPFDNEMLNGGLVVALYVSMAFLRGVYDPRKHGSVEGTYIDALRVWCVAVLVFAFGSLMTHGFFVDRPARIALLIGVGGLMLVGWRLVQVRLYPNFALYHTPRRRVLVIGADSDAERILDLHESRGDDRSLLVGYCDDREFGSIEHPRLLYLGPVARVPILIENLEIDDVLVAFPWAAAERIATTVDTLRFLPVRVLLSPEKILRAIPPTGFVKSFGFDVPMLQRPPIAPRWWLVKGAIDRVGSALLLALLSPLFLLIALAIKLDSRGPVFFRQDRLGLNEHPFRIWKFRTLRHETADATVERQVQRGDDRVTAVGAVLRKFSLDELPQLINVLTGEMSLIGPRPHAPGTKVDGIVFSHAIRDYGIRYRVKPGMTGWAQINGWRGDTATMDKLRNRIEYDHYYIANWSLALDLLILLRTPGAIASAKNSV